MIKEEARARLLAVWENERVKVVSAKSQTCQAGARQARQLQSEPLLQRSWWHKIGLEQAFPALVRVEERRIGLPTPTPTKKTKATLPVDELRAEIQQMGKAGELTTSWNKDAGRLAIWCHEKHPEKPGAVSTIRNNPILENEHDKLKPPKP
jgi:hypothetical protein